MVEYTQTIRRHQPTNFLSVIDHFEGLAFKGLLILGTDGRIRKSLETLKHEKS